MGDLFRLAQTADRLPLVQFASYLFFFMLVILFQVSLDEGRVDRSGANAIDADHRGIIDRKLPGHGYHRAFGRAVGKSPLDANQPGHGTNVDDRTLGGNQQRQGMLGHQKHAGDVDAVQAVEIRQLRFLGRAHTAGDVVVYLPREKIAITGDLLTADLSNMSDAYVNEWVGTLDELQKLDFTTVLPGHGEAFTDRNKIDYFQAYLADVWSEVGRLKRQGLSAEDAAARADLTKHRPHFPGITAPGVPLIGVTRIYELLDAQK